MHIRTTTRHDGDLSIDVAPAVLDQRRRTVVDLPWVWLRQVHGARVVRVSHGWLDEVRGTSADALVTTDENLALAVQSADCVPISFDGGSVIGVAHAGWRGLQAGVVASTVAALRGLGATAIEATIGPCIHTECYAFAEEDLAPLVERFGSTVRGSTSDGAPALDLGAAARRALAEVAVDEIDEPYCGPHGCTSCNPTQWYSHRARTETARMATVVWRSADGVGGALPAGPTR